MSTFIKEHLKSGAITFGVAFLTALGVGISTITPDAITRDFFLSLAFTAFRAGVKAIVDYAILLSNQSKSRDITDEIGSATVSSMNQSDV